MRLDFKTIWFEDNSSSLIHKIELVRERVEREGYNFVEPERYKIATNLVAIELNDFNIIFADLELINDPIGLYLIESIRDGTIIADIVIYSNKGEDYVRKNLLHYKIDGIYCAGKKEDDFEIKIDKVLNRIIKRKDNLNNLRGLVMAQTSAFDNVMDDIIDNSLQIKSFKNELVNQIFDSTKNFVEEKTKEYKKLDKLRKEKICKLIDNHILFDASKKSYTIQFIIDKLGIILDNIESGSYSKLYEDDINIIRNDLAHVYEANVDDSPFVVDSEGEQIVFDQKHFIKIRKLLYKHKVILDNIDSYVKLIKDNQK